MLFEELLTIIFCYFIPYKTDVSRHKKVIHCPPRNRRVKQYCTEFAKNIVVPDLVIATGRPIQMVQIFCNTDVILSYLIFVTGATGGACVNFFGRCNFLQF